MGYCQAKITKYDTSKTFFIFTADLGTEIIEEYLCKFGSVENINNEYRRILQPQLQQKFAKTMTENGIEDNLTKFVDVIAAYQPLSPNQMTQILTNSVHKEIENEKGKKWKWVDIDSKLIYALAQPETGQALYEKISKEKCKMYYGEKEQKPYHPIEGFMSVYGARPIFKSIKPNLFTQLRDRATMCPLATRDYDKDNIILKVEYDEYKRKVDFYRCKEYIYNEENYDEDEFSVEDKRLISAREGQVEGVETTLFCRKKKTLALADIQ